MNKTQQLVDYRDTKFRLTTNSVYTYVCNVENMVLEPQATSKTKNKHVFSLNKLYK